jgi:hypothetical protein
MTAVVREVAERYGHHASFRGVAVHLDSESNTLLPDATCSLDDRTFARFLRESAKDFSTTDVSSPADRWQLVCPFPGADGPAAKQWLRWRS